MECGRVPDARAGSFPRNRDHDVLPGSRAASFSRELGDFDIEVSIEEGVVTGTFPRRALRHVLEWYELHRDELRENWKRAAARKPLKKIAPLE